MLSKSPPLLLPGLVAPFRAQKHSEMPLDPEDCPFFNPKLAGLLALAPYGLRAALAARGPPAFVRGREPPPDRLGPVAVDRAVRYADAPRCLVDVYVPGGAGAAARPTVLFVHGGVWASGERWQYAPLGFELARAGCLAYVASYTLYPQAGAERQAEEVGAALDFVRASAAGYGGDAEGRLTLIGHSSGAHICALALLRRPAAAFRPARFVGLAGVFDVRARCTPFFAAAHSPSLRFTSRHHRHPRADRRALEVRRWPGGGADVDHASRVRRAGQFCLCVACADPVATWRQGGSVGCCGPAAAHVFAGFRGRRHRALAGLRADAHSGGGSGRLFPPVDVPSRGPRGHRHLVSVAGRRGPPAAARGGRAELGAQLCAGAGGGQGTAAAGRGALALLSGRGWPPASALSCGWTSGPSTPHPAQLGRREGADGVHDSARHGGERQRRADPGRGGERGGEGGDGEIEQTRTYLVVVVVAAHLRRSGKRRRKEFSALHENVRHNAKLVTRSDKRRR